MAEETSTSGWLALAAVLGIFLLASSKRGTSTKDLSLFLELKRNTKAAFTRGLASDALRLESEEMLEGDFALLHSITEEDE